MRAYQGAQQQLAAAQEQQRVENHQASVEGEQELQNMYRIRARLEAAEEQQRVDNQKAELDRRAELHRAALAQQEQSKALASKCIA
eukprot:COSAG02_NODE_36818_length_450_cov_0.666667_1_plen_85_part_10